MKTILEQIEVMQHFANGGQVMRRECGDRFVDVTSPVWDWSSCDYYIKPKTKKTKKIKLLAWFSGSVLGWWTEDKEMNGWQRVHSEDKEIEIEVEE